LGQARFTLVFDFVDPGSYLAWEVLGRVLGPEREHRVHPHPLELRPPPAPLIRTGDPEWQAMDEAMARIAEGLGVSFSPPAFVPWTRKAHELALHAAEKGKLDQAVDRLFRTRFREGGDLGRVDLLLTVATGIGLDQAEARTVLGVDRFAPAVEEARAEALDAGIRGVPTLVERSDQEQPWGRIRMEGFRGVEEWRALMEELDGGHGHE
jgi:predicted DsbA family dithiol-disulfide isomerase